MNYEDEFSVSFKEEAALHQYLARTEETAWWKRVPSSGLSVLTVSGHETMASGVPPEERNGILADTLGHTGLLLRGGGSTYFLGSTAMPTLLRRARISGPALSEVDRPVLAEILNECLKVSRGKALLRFFEGKIRAVHAGDAKDYSVIPMTDIFMLASMYIDTDFARAKYREGCTDHVQTSALWSVEDEKLCGAYAELLKHYGRESPGNLKTEIRITTSDVAASGANISYSVRDGKNTIVLGQSLKTIHRGSQGIEQVEENLQNLYQIYQETLKGMDKLFHIRIEHPANTMAGLMDSVKIGKKLIAETVETYRSETDDAPCTAYDVYCGICHALFLAESQGADVRTMMELEENIARCITRNWKDYDLPGELALTGKALRRKGGKRNNGRAQGGLLAA